MKYSFKYQNVEYDLNMSDFSSYYAGSSANVKYKATLTNTGIPTSYYVNGQMLYATVSYVNSIRAIRISSGSEPNQDVYLDYIRFDRAVTGTLKVFVETASDGYGAQGAWSEYDDGSQEGSSYREVVLNGNTYAYLTPSGVGIKMPGACSISGTRYRIKAEIYDGNNLADQLFITYILYEYDRSNNVVSITRGPVTGRKQYSGTQSHDFAWNNDSATYDYNNNNWE